MLRKLLRAYIIIIIVCLIITPFAKTNGFSPYMANIMRQGDWITLKTKKIHLHVYKNSEAEKDKDNILKTREDIIMQLEEFFDRKAPKPIDIFLYPSYREAEGFPVGTAYPASFACFGVYEYGKWCYEKHNFGHEITHIFSNTDKSNKQVYPIGLLDEGLAEYFSGFILDPHLRLTQHWQAHGVDHAYINIKAENLEYNSPSLYQIAGSFVKFLIENHDNGREKFLSLLQQTVRSNKYAKADFNRFIEKTESIYNTDFAVLINNWNKTLSPYWLKKYDIGDDYLKEIQNLMAKKGYGRIKKVYYESFSKFLRLVLLTERSKRIFIEASSDGWGIKKWQNK